MDFYEAIKNRYSVRSYKNQPVEDQKLQRVLDSARIAPTGNNRQAWKFVVVQDGKLRKALGEASEQPWMAKAPVIIAVVGLDPQRMMSCDIPADPVDCSIAITYMMLAAVVEGLGSCWIGHFNQDACRNLLNVPVNYKIVAMLPMGYPDQPPRSKERKALSEIVSQDRF